MSDRLSRPERRALVREDEGLLSMPVNIGGDSRRVEAQIRHLVGLFRSDRSASPSSDVMAHILGIFDKTTPVSTNAKVACKRGCAHCCYQRVTILAPEAFAIANYIRSDKDKIAAIIQTHQQTKGLSEEQRRHARVPCPLLNEAAACSIYAMRPTGCRGAMSLDVNACIAAYVDLKNTGIPMPIDHIKTMNVMRMILSAAMTLVQLPITGFELIGAVAVALSENAEQRWRSGENVFASVDVDSSTPPVFLAQVDGMARRVAPTV